MNWRKIDDGLWIRSDSTVAVALHFSGEGWFVQSLTGGSVDGYSSAEAAMESADRNFQTAKV